MNCCTYDCDQGDNCPARKCPHCRGIGYDASGYACTCTAPAKVAKAKPVMHDRQILPPTRWREQIKQLAKWMLASYMLVLLGLVAYAMVYYAAGVVSMVYALVK